MSPTSRLDYIQPPPVTRTGSLAGSLGLVTLIGVILIRGDSSNPYLGYVHKGRYLLPDDFRGTWAKHELAKIQQDLDRIADAARVVPDASVDWVLLAHQEWEIALALSRQSQIRRELDVRLDQAAGPQVRSVLEAQSQAWQSVQDSLGRRIAALASYANAFQAAKNAYLDWHQAQTYAQENPHFENLLATTADDEVGQSSLARATQAITPLAQAYGRQLEQVADAAERLRHLTRTV